MAAAENSTEALLELASRGDDAARELLFARHRARLKRMIEVRIDGRLAARIDPSDVVQETQVLIDETVAHKVSPIRPLHPGSPEPTLRAPQIEHRRSFPKSIDDSSSFPSSYGKSCARRRRGTCRRTDARKRREW